jgi:hypothetical protein
MSLLLGLLSSLVLELFVGFSFFNIELPFCMHDDIPLDAFDSCSRLMIVDPIYEKNAIYERK